MFEAVLASGLVALCSLIGVLFFGNSKKLEGIEKYVVPTAVGIFLALVLFELIPETLHANELWGGIVIGVGFILFYVLSYELHRYFHTHQSDDKDCDRKGAATLLLIGDAVHNLADGVILGTAFLIDPTLGVVTAIGLALHEIPQEIVEFGVLIRGGYTRWQAAWRNLMSASSIVVGTIFTILVAEAAGEYLWVITGLAAGNLLYLAATDLLPRVHGNLKNYQSFWMTLLALVIGFVVMVTVISYTHDEFGHGHEEDEQHLDEEKLHDHYHENNIPH